MASCENSADEGRGRYIDHSTARSLHMIAAHNLRHDIRKSTTPLSIMELNALQLHEERVEQENRTCDTLSIIEKARTRIEEELCISEAKCKFVQDATVGMKDVCKLEKRSAKKMKQYMTRSNKFLECIGDSDILAIAGDIVSEPPALTYSDKNEDNLLSTLLLEKVCHPPPHWKT